MEKQSADELAFVNSLVFLISGQHWIHPEQAPLFDYSFVESSIAACNEAVVSHRYVSERTGAGTHTVMTAVLNPRRGTPLVLGMIGPDTRYGGRTAEDRFADLAARARQVLPDMEILAERIRTELQQDYPMLAIEQSTGTVIAANPAARQITDELVYDPIGALYANTVEALGRRISTDRLEARRMIGADTAVSLVCFRPDTKEAKEDITLERTILEMKSTVDQLQATVRELENADRPRQRKIAPGAYKEINTRTRDLVRGIQHLEDLALSTTELQHTD
jgi:hypothetical protein